MSPADPILFFSPDVFFYEDSNDNVFVGQQLRYWRINSEILETYQKDQDRHIDKWDLGIK